MLSQSLASQLSQLLLSSVSPLADSGGSEMPNLGGGADRTPKKKWPDLIFFKVHLIIFVRSAWFVVDQATSIYLYLSPNPSPFQYR